MRQTFGTQNIVLHWRRGFFAFCANVGAEESLVALYAEKMIDPLRPLLVMPEVLQFFQSRGIDLAERAGLILAK